MIDAQTYLKRVFHTATSAARINRMFHKDCIFGSVHIIQNTVVSKHPAEEADNLTVMAISSA